MSAAPPTPPPAAHRAVLVRPRRDDDLPALATALAEQRELSQYPLRWPYPGPLERFIARDHELGAWVAEVDGRPVGHIATRPVLPRGDGTFVPEAVAWQEGTGRPAEQLGMIATFFTARSARGQGVGRVLHDTAVADLRDRGLTPCLDVVPEHADAWRFYQRLGWREVGRPWDDWLPPGTGPMIAMVLDPPAGPTPD